MKKILSILITTSILLGSFSFAATDATTKLVLTESDAAKIAISEDLNLKSYAKQLLILEKKQSDLAYKISNTDLAQWVNDKERVQKAQILYVEPLQLSNEVNQLKRTIKNTELDLTNSVNTLYVNLENAEHALLKDQANYQDKVQGLADTEKKNSLGLTTSLDVADAKYERDNAQLTLQTSQRLRDKYRQDLLELLNLEPDRTVEFKYTTNKVLSAPIVSTQEAIAYRANQDFNVLNAKELLAIAEKKLWTFRTYNLVQDDTDDETLTQHLKDVEIANLKVAQELKGIRVSFYAKEQALRGAFEKVSLAQLKTQLQKQIIDATQVKYKLGLATKTQADQANQTYLNTLNSEAFEINSYAALRAEFIRLYIAQ